MCSSLHAPAAGRRLTRGTQLLSQDGFTSMSGSFRLRLRKEADGRKPNAPEFISFLVGLEVGGESSGGPVQEWLTAS